MSFAFAGFWRGCDEACSWASRETPPFMDLTCSLSRLQQPNQLWRSLAGLSPRRTGFGPRPDNVGFVVDNTAMGRVSRQYSTLTLPVLFLHFSIYFHTSVAEAIFPGA
jgi:hypothetical protein